MRAIEKLLENVHSASRCFQKSTLVNNYVVGLLSSMISSSPFLTQKSEKRCVLCDCSLEDKDVKLVHQEAEIDCSQKSSDLADKRSDIEARKRMLPEKEMERELVSFSKVEGKLVVFSSELGPVTYVQAALKGQSLREDNPTRAFARLVRRKLENKQPVDCPRTPNQLSKSLENFLLNFLHYQCNSLVYFQTGKQIVVAWSRLVKHICRRYLRFRKVESAVQSTADPDAGLLDEMEMSDEEMPDFGSFKIQRHRKDPPSFSGFQDEFKESKLIKNTFEKDSAWVIVSAIRLDYVVEVENDFDVERVEPIGSWTSFKKRVTNLQTSKCKLEYTPVIPLPLSDNVIKWYVDAIIQIIDNLSINHIFVPADEALNSEMLIIFGCTKVEQQKFGAKITIENTFDCDSAWVIVSAIRLDYVVEVKNDFDVERVEPISSWTSFKKRVTNLQTSKIFKLAVINDMTTELKQSIAEFRITPSPETLAVVIQQPEFKILLSHLLHTTGTQSKRIVEYMRDVAAMLCQVSSVREHSIDWHLAAERALIPKRFAFGHPNYSCYLKYQHVKLLNIMVTDREIWNELVQNGFGGSLSGARFSTIHGDLITETTKKREVKVRGGLYKEALV
eukprot:gene19769-21703_t